MTEEGDYDIVIEGYTSGLTKHVLKTVIEDQFPHVDTVQVMESESTED